MAEPGDQEVVAPEATRLWVEKLEGVEEGGWIARQVVRAVGEIIEKRGADEAINDFVEEFRLMKTRMEEPLPEGLAESFGEELGKVVYVYNRGYLLPRTMQIVGVPKEKIEGYLDRIEEIYPELPELQEVTNETRRILAKKEARREKAAQRRGK